MKKFLFSGMATIVALSLFSCSSTKEVENIPADVRYQQAKELYDEGQYLEAIEEFKIVIVQYQGSEFADDAQFFLAESRFNREEFILAAAEYDNLVRTMPTSRFATLSRYKKGLSHYLLSPKPQLDQKFSRYAIDDFQTYIEYSPKDSLVGDTEKKIGELTEKLAQKIFESGKLYYRLDYFRASISYFDKVISEYNDTPYADDAMFWKAKSQNERKDFTAATATLTELLQRFPATDLMEEVRELQIEIGEDEAVFQSDVMTKKNASNE